MKSSVLHKSIQSVAAVEAAKGLLALVVACGLVTLLNGKYHSMAAQIARTQHLNPASRSPGIFVDLMTNLTESRLWLLSVLALAYASARFIESYGLWLERRWAEWFALASASIYIPFEIYEIVRNGSVVMAGALVINIVVVYLMAYALLHPDKASRQDRVRK